MNFASKLINKYPKPSILTTEKGLQKNLARPYDKNHKLM